MTYSLRKTLSGKGLVVVGGTGFLGKVWLALVLTQFPEIEHIYLVVRPKDGQGVLPRFREKIVGSEVFYPLRQKLGSGFDDFIASKVTPMAGDVSLPLCGIASDLRDTMRGKIAAVVNVAGVVDFDPPLDEALQVNAFGCQNLVALTRDLGAQGILHTSTCYTAGSRTGPIAEQDPRIIPFPKAGELDERDWSPEREIQECLDVIEQARHRAGDAFRQSRFLDEARQNLAAHHEPSSGSVLDDEVARVRRKFVEKQLSALGTERARHWGWPNTYTYTKSLGEQIIASSGLPFCIVRPAIVESTLAFPFPGWNEGINTSAPFIFLIREGGLQVPGSKNNLDFIPCDLVCSAIVIALGELIAGEARPVYQAASSDTNPCTMERFFELSGLYKRKYYQKTQRGGPILSKLQERYESALLSKAEYQAFGPSRLAEGAELAGNLLGKLPLGPLGGAAKAAKKGLGDFASGQRRLARVMDIFLPFVAEYHYIFETKETRRAFDRLPPEEQELVPYRPADIDWRKWFMEIHAPALERHVFPLMEAKLKRPPRVPRPHASLTSMLRDTAERYELRPFLQRAEPEGLRRLSYRQVERLSLAVAAQLREMGVTPGARVLLSGANSPEWPIAFFGILSAGATVVPVDSALTVAEVRVIVEASGSQHCILSQAQREKCEGLVGRRGIVALESLADERNIPHGGGVAGVAAQVSPDDLACLLYTSGTTGKPKGVMLSHGNITALIAALAPLFPLGPGDRLVSVLPLHHTFELSCGLLLPMSRGASVTYLDEVNGDRLSAALKESRATAMIGVPALWELLERRILSRVREKGAWAEQAFDAALEVTRAMGQATGVDFGRALFGTVHQELGGHLKYLVSGGAALNPETHSLFQGLGLPLAEGYGLTEAAPVLAVQLAGPRAKAGTVGKAVPGVELRIEQPGPDGVGEVLARGPNVMQGYVDDAESTAQVLSADGWLRTGDLGKLDGRGRLTLVGRKKDVVVASNGENLYPDDIETQLGEIPCVREYAVLGVPDGRGGERLALVAQRDIAAAFSEERVREAIKEACERLLPRARPALVVVIDEELPKTSTKKIKRSAVRQLIELRGTETGGGAKAPASSGDPLLETVRRALGEVTRRREAEIWPQASLRGDLGLDSLQALELLAVLERALGTSLDAERLASAVTVSDLVRAVEAGTPRRSRTAAIEQSAREERQFPEPVRRLGSEAIETAQRLLYGKALQVKVSGRAHVPHNRNTLVVANHQSHLDMGLVKHALGSYGEGMKTLAAQDYFFEGNEWKKAIVEQMTDLVPMSRGGSLRAALRRAGELLDEGHTVLIFPEGTRSPDGVMREFKASLGHLSLHHRVDVLPVWLGGTYSVLPRGAAVPRGRNVEARIGRPISHRDLLAWTDGLGAPDAAKVATRIVELAVKALASGTAWDPGAIDVAELRRTLVPEDAGLGGVLDEMRRRFVPGAAEGVLTYYLSLGEERWTIRVDNERIDIAQGKTVDTADCVLKTSPELFERIIREAYVPGPAEFFSGALKTSNVGHLMKLQKLFQLQIPSTKFDARGAGREEVLS